LRLCEWKTARTKSKVAANSADLVKDATRISFSVAAEELRIGVLTLLAGVSWPTASVILHFCHRNRYPILDYRALWSVSSEQPSQYTFKLWWEYTRFCRAVAKEASVSMRDLDRALWQYSKENQ